MPTENKCNLAESTYYHHNGASKGEQNVGRSVHVRYMVPPLDTQWRPQGLNAIPPPNTNERPWGGKCRS